MARRDDVLGVAGAQTVIGAGVLIEGTLEGDGDIIVDGTLNGDIICTGDVTVGVNGIVASNITAQNVTVAGRLRGNVKASGEVTIRESGRLQGNVLSANLTIGSGGVFIGSSRIQSSQLQLEEDA